MNKPIRHRFPKAEKLKSRKQIDLLFREGKSFFAAPVKCYYKVDRWEMTEDREQLAVGSWQLADDRDEMTDESSLGGGKGENEKIINHKPQTSNIKAGFSASKRQFKKATDRNRIKRLMREAWRLHKHQLAERLRQSGKSLEVFLVFTDKTLPAFSLVEEKIKYCVRRLGKIVEGEI